MKRNDHKGGWEDMTLGELLDRLREEIAELRRTVATGGDSREIISEAADVANFAMMIADVAKDEARRGPQD